MEHKAIVPLKAATLSECLQTVAAWLDTLEGATSEEERQDIERAMDREMALSSEKVDAYVTVWRQVEAQRKLVTESLGRLKARKAALDAWEERMRANAYMALKEANLPHVKGAQHGLTLVPCTPALDIYDGAALPRGYVTFEVLVEPDKARIKQALLDGRDVPGARLMGGQTVRRT